MQTETRARRLLMPEDLRRPFRFAPRRNPDLRTRGGKIGVLARELGRPLKPHQQYIADVGTELNPPGSHLLFRYQTVIIAEPRQVGKTTLLRPVFLDRCLMAPGTDTFMTAQKGKDAAARWEDLIGDLEPSIFGRFATIKRGKGDQSVTFPNNSTISPFPPVRDGLHGESPDLVGADECWAHSMEDGRDLMRAIRPAQITRRARQLWLLSAAGTAESEWWNELVEIGRESTKDPNSTIAYFEHSAPEDSDPYDPATWEFHPGLEGLITIEDLAEEAKPANNTHGDFLRGFMNLSTTTRDNTVIDLDAWDDLAAEQDRPDPRRVAYGYDVAIDRTNASVWAAWRDDDGRMNLHVHRTDTGAEWLPEYVGNLYADGQPTIGADDGGPARIVTDALHRAGVPVETLGGKDASTAWGAIKAAVPDRALRHDGSPAMRAALAVAVERTIGDAVLLSRRHSLGPIDPPVAATVAAWFADRLDPGLQVF